jgi:hypothetical protein
MCAQDIENVAVFPDNNTLMKSLDRSIVDYAITSNLNGLVQLKKIGNQLSYCFKASLRKETAFSLFTQKA